MDIEENLEMKVLGLELSEEVWRKKWEEQQKMASLEKQRLEQWESELNIR